MLRNSTPREWRRQNSPIRNRKGDNKMKKRDFNVVGNKSTDNQELAKGIAFVKSRRAEAFIVGKRPIRGCIEISGCCM